MNIEVDTIVTNAILLENVVHMQYSPKFIMLENMNSQNLETNYDKSVYYFIEGRPDNYDQETTITDLERYNIFDKKILNNNEDNLKIRNSRYLITAEDGYRNIINNKTNMIKGYIECTPYLSKCEVDINNIYFRCFRSKDGLFIGKYTLSNGIAFIPNLDCNTEYDIILVDESKTLEQKVKSRIKPKPYPPTNIIGLHNIIDITTVENEDESVIIRWNYNLIQGGQFGNIRVYHSNNDIDIDNLIEYKYRVPTARSYIIIPRVHKNFVIEHIKDNIVDYYRVTHNNFIPRYLTHKIEYEKFRSAPIALQHKLEYDEEE